MSICAGSVRRCCQRFQLQCSSQSHPHGRGPGHRAWQSLAAHAVCSTDYLSTNVAAEDGSPACSSARPNALVKPGGPCSASRAPANTRGGSGTGAASVCPGCGSSHLPAATHACTGEDAKALTLPDFTKLCTGEHLLWIRRWGSVVAAAASVASRHGSLQVMIREAVQLQHEQDCQAFLLIWYCGFQRAAC